MKCVKLTWMHIYCIKPNNYHSKCVWLEDGLTLFKDRDSPGESHNVVVQVFWINLNTPFFLGPRSCVLHQIQLFFLFARQLLRILSVSLHPALQGLVTAISTSIPSSLFKEVVHITGPWVLDAIDSALMSGNVMSSCFLTCSGRAPHQKATVLTPPFYRGPSPSLLFFFCLGAGGKWTAAMWCWSRWCFWELPVWL